MTKHKRSMAVAVGSPSRRSSVWKIKVSNDDIYIIHSNLGGMLKASRHEGGWFFQHTSESVRKYFEATGLTHDRLIERWDVEDLISSGIEWKLSIIIPDTELANRGPIHSKGRVRWYFPRADASSDATVLHFAVTLKQSVYPALRHSDTFPFGPVATKSGGAAWLLPDRMLLPEWIRKNLQDFKQKVLTSPAESLQPHWEWSGISLVRHENDVRSLIDVSLYEVAAQRGLLIRDSSISRMTDQESKGSTK